MRLVLFGDGRWAADTLRLLVRDGHEPLAVVMRERPSDDSLEQASREMPCARLSPPRVNAPESLHLLSALQADLAVSVSYNQIFGRTLLGLFPQGVINLHAGKLPLYRGRNVINWALINGEAEVGITAHYVDEGIDTGDIILQTTLPVGWTDTYGEVLARTVAALPGVAAEAVSRIAAGTAERRPQPRSLGTYYPGRGEADEWLDWNETSRDLHNKVRAITRPAPGARTLHGDVEVRIWAAYADPAWTPYRATPGVVVGRGDNGVLVKTGDSVLLVREAQEGAGPCGVPRWPIGTRLGANLAERVRALGERVAALERRLAAYATASAGGRNT